MDAEPVQIGDQHYRLFHHAELPDSGRVAVRFQWTIEYLREQGLSAVAFNKSVGEVFEQWFAVAGDPAHESWARTDPVYGEICIDSFPPCLRIDESDHAAFTRWGELSPEQRRVLTLRFPVDQQARSSWFAVDRPSGLVMRWLYQEALEACCGAAATGDP